MEQSAHMTPRVFSLMWMMSHPESLVEQFIHTISGIILMMQMVLKSLVNSRTVLLNIYEDGVPSWSRHQKCKRRREFLVMSISQFLTGATKSWSQHQKCKRRREFLLNGISSIWCHKISWSQHQKCKRSFYFLVMSLFMLQSDAMTSWFMAPEMQEVSLYKLILMFMSVS